VNHIPPLARAFALLAAVALAGCASSQRALPTADQLDSDALMDMSAYVIGPQDVIQIGVWKQPELSVDTLVVRPDGKISLPLLDDVQAAGLTPLELKSVVAERWGEFITAPHVTVIVRQVNSKQVYVIGEVARQGPYAIRGEFRIVDALSAAGGFGAFAGRNNIKVIRDRVGSGPVEFRFNYEEFVDGKNLEQNIALLPGDRIVVPEESPFWR
jgi:polysaccharide export outer membrane protein